MKNIERLAKHIAKNGADGTLVHTIPGTNNWIICQKIEDNKWLLTLCNPMGNVTYNLGIVSNEQHLALWEEIIHMEVEKRTSQILMAKDLRQKVHNYLTKHEQKVFKKFIKVNNKTSQKQYQLAQRKQIRPGDNKAKRKRKNRIQKKKNNR